MYYQPLFESFWEFNFLSSFYFKLKKKHFVGSKTNNFVKKKMHNCKFYTDFLKKKFKGTKMNNFKFSKDYF